MDLENIDWSKTDLSKAELDSRELGDLVLLLLEIEDKIRLSEKNKAPKQLLERQLALAHLIQHRLSEEPIDDVNRLMGYAKALRDKYCPDYDRMRRELYDAQEKLANIARMAKPYKNDGPKEGQ